MAVRWRPQVAAQAGQYIKYHCKKGECGTCEVRVDGKWIRTCVSQVPYVEAGDTFSVHVKGSMKKPKKSARFYSFRSIVAGWKNNLMGMFGFVREGARSSGRCGQPAASAATRTRAPPGARGRRGGAWVASWALWQGVPGGKKNEARARTQVQGAHGRRAGADGDRRQEEGREGGRGGAAKVEVRPRHVDGMPAVLRLRTGASSVTYTVCARAEWPWRRWARCFVVPRSSALASQHFRINQITCGSSLSPASSVLGS